MMHGQKNIVKENKIDESSDNYEREQKYILGFGFFSGGEG